MLAYILALAVGIGSLAIYMAAFFFPEVHRKGDFVWSGVGLFYALVLWVCSGRITGGVLLGQVAGVALLGWSVTQTLSLRRQLTPRVSQTEVPSAQEVKSTVQEKVSQSSFLSKLSQLTKRGSDSAATAKNRLQQNLSEQKTQLSEALATDTEPVSTPPPSATVEVIELTTPTEPSVDSSVITPDAVTELAPEETTASASIEEITSSNPTAETESAELVRPHPPAPELVEAALKDAEEKHQEAEPPEPETPEQQE